MRLDGQLRILTQAREARKRGHTCRLRGNISASAACPISHCLIEKCIDIIERCPCRNAVTGSDAIAELARRRLLVHSVFLHREERIDPRCGIDVYEL